MFEIITFIMNYSAEIKVLLICLLIILIDAILLYKILKEK